MSARREKEEASDAVQVGKHKTDRVDMWERRPKMTDAAAQARAMIWRMRVYVRYLVIVSGMLNSVTPNNVLGSGVKASVSDSIECICFSTD